MVSICNLHSIDMADHGRSLAREFVSSEESGEGVVDGEKRSVLLVKPLPWRASKLDRIFK